MKERNESRASSNRALIERELDRLISELTKACSKPRKRNDPGLEDCRRALRLARKLRQRIDDELEQVGLLDVLYAVVALAELAKFFSILFYMHPRGAVMRIGTMIKTLRTVQGLAQGELAKRLDVTRAYLSQIENNRRQPSLPFLRQTSDVLKVPLVLLIPMEDGCAGNEHIMADLRRILGDMLTSFLNRIPGEQQREAEPENEASGVVEDL